MSQAYNKLVDAIIRHNHLYFVEQTPVISDTEYDALFSQLVEWEKKNPTKIRRDSPTQLVGEIPSGLFPKEPHLFQMYSLDKTYELDGLTQFVKRVDNAHSEVATFPYDDSVELSQFHCSAKMDGVAIELIYRDGKFNKAITRGDGIEGDDITENVLGIPNIPLQYGGSRPAVSIRGEVVIHKSDFMSINYDRESYGLSVFSNSRNYVAGSLRQKDSSTIKDRKLLFYAYEILGHNPTSETVSEQYNFLASNGWSVPKFVSCTGMDNLEQTIYDFVSSRSSLPYQADGIVIKTNMRDERKFLGANNHAPKWALAFKFSNDGVITTVENVHWEMGRTGKMTPVASIKPVNIGGALIREVNVFNADYVDTHQLGAGSSVVVIRRGDVIPRLSGTPGPSESYTGLPTVCPYCGEALVKSGPELRCVNPSCEEILVKQLMYIVSRDALNVQGIGASFIRNMVKDKLVTKFTDLFVTLESDNPKISQDLLHALVKRTRNINLVELLLISGISGMGKAVASRLTMEVHTLANLIKILTDPKKEEVLKYLPINSVVKDKLIKWYSFEKNATFWDFILKLKLPRC